jgi:hypothetical protein
MRARSLSKQWHGGKGDTPRSPNDELYRSNWDRIFGGIDYDSLDKEKMMKKRYGKPKPKPKPR